MKAQEKQRVGALRLVLSELQKAAKEGGDDELAVLRRERKRRLEAASQFRDGGRPELADQEEAEAELIAGYMPAELSDEDLDAIVTAAIAETGASSPKEMGQVMKVVMAKSQGRADGKRASARVREALAQPIAQAARARQCSRRRIGGQRGRGAARTLEGHLDCDVSCGAGPHSLGRSSAVDAEQGRGARAVEGHAPRTFQIAAGTIEAVTNALDQHESASAILEDVVLRRRNTKVAPRPSTRSATWTRCATQNTITFEIDLLLVAASRYLDRAARQRPYKPARSPG